MEFICAYHQRQLEALSLSQLQDLWLLWMESALWNYEQGNWCRGASFSGCAFDLARLAHRRHQTLCMPVEMTLAAILLARVLREQGQPSEAEAILDRARELLSRSHRPAQPILSEQVDECLQVLRLPGRQGAFFETYLNWPAIFNDRALAGPVFH